MGVWIGQFAWKIPVVVDCEFCGRHKVKGRESESLATCRLGEIMLAGILLSNGLCCLTGICDPSGDVLE